MSDTFVYTPDPEDIDDQMPDEIKVDGKPIDLRNPLAGDDPAVALVRWGRILGEAEREYELARAHYRHWRATYGVSIAKRFSKSPEWKVNLELEATDNYVRYKSGIADASRNVRVLTAIYKAWEIKGSKQ